MTSGYVYIQPAKKGKSRMREKAQVIAALNDAFRKSMISSSRRYVMTDGISSSFSPDDVLQIFREVAAFSAFTEENDPYGEHDFGQISYGGEGIFWKIDYYDNSLTRHSDDPTDPLQTTRVLTVMLAHEY